MSQIHCKVCEVLQRKYTSILSSDDETAGLGSEVIAQFCHMKPLFEQLEKVTAADALYARPTLTTPVARRRDVEAASRT